MKVMKVMGLEIPQAAIDAGHGAMKGLFRFDDVRSAVAETLRTLDADPASPFSYDIQPKDAVDDRASDRIMQAARMRGQIRFLGAKGWKAEGMETSGPA